MNVTFTDTERDLIKSVARARAAWGKLRPGKTRTFGPDQVAIDERGVAGEYAVLKIMRELDCPSFEWPALVGGARLDYDLAVTSQRTLFEVKSIWAGSKTKALIRNAPSWDMSIIAGILVWVDHPLLKSARIVGYATPESWRRTHKTSNLGFGDRWYVEEADLHSAQVLESHLRRKFAIANASVGGGG